ncbi:MAG: START-like domain-containing protein [Rikenellaceae bacterium]
MSREKFTCEYLINTTPKSLFRFVSTPTGLSNWFADSVKQDDKDKEYFIVKWGKSLSRIKLIEHNPNYLIKYCWEEDEGSPYFFEFEIDYDELTKVVSLKVIDFAEDDEKDSLQAIWDSNIKQLKHGLGSK